MFHQHDTETTTAQALSETGTQWLSVFKHPRQPFDEASENQTYLNFLRSITEAGNDSEPEIISHAEDDTDGTGRHDNQAGGDDGDDVLAEPPAENGSGDEADDDEDDNDDDDSEDEVACDEPSSTLFGPRESAVSRLSSSLPGTDESVLTQHPNEMEAVIAFVKHRLSSFSEISGDPGERGPRVALLDDYFDEQDVTMRKPRPKNRTQGRGGLFGAELMQRLQALRFVERSTTEPLLPRGPALNRRVIYVPDLDAPEMETLAQTVSIKQRLALLAHFQHHIKPKPSIGVSIPSRGFRTFSLHIHLPYLALRQHKSLYQDHRTKPDGTPLRKSWQLLFMRQAKPRKIPCLYEIQKSMTLVGIDDQVWTVYCTMDTAFEGTKSQDSIAHYHRERKTRSEPVSRRQFPVNKVDPSFKDARNYFWTVLENWTVDVERECRVIREEFKELLEQGCPEHIKQDIHQFDTWNNDVSDHLRRIISSLSDILYAFDRFGKDLRYFTPDSQVHYYTNIDRHVGDLRFHQQALGDLRKSSAKANGERVNTEIGFQSYQAADDVKVLAILAIIFAPLSHVTAIFNINDSPLRLSPKNFFILFAALAAAHTIMYLLVSRCRGSVASSFTKVIANLASFDPFLRLAVSRACAFFNAALELLTGKNITLELQGSQSEGPTRSTRLEPPLVTDPNHIPRRALAWWQLSLPSISLPDTISIPNMPLPPLPGFSMPSFSRGRSRGGMEEYELPVVNTQRSTLSAAPQSSR